MSFDFPQKPRRRKKGGLSGIVMLLVIGFGLFVFMNMRGPGPDGNGGDIESGSRPVENRSAGNLDPRIDRELREADEYRRQRESILGDPKPETARRSTDSKAMPSGRAKGNSDWSIEGVGNKSRSPDAKKTQGKDGWSIEEVPSKKKSGVGLELKNSGGGDVELKEKSDWSLKDVEPKTKKTTEGDWSVEEVKGGGK